MGGAFYDSAALELSSRMSISLTIMLTLAAYTTERPPAIEKAPYVTFHDRNEQVCMGIVIMISFENIFAVANCAGEHDDAPQFMKDEFNEGMAGGGELCGWTKLCLLGTRKVDCY